MKKFLWVVLAVMLFMLPGSMTAYADSIGGTGDTGQGNIGGSNVYTFYYYYNSSHDAIELTVNTKNPIKSFGNTTSHTYSSPSDGTVLNTANPQLGRSLESAIADMNAVGGYNLSAADAKASLNALGYYDKGNGVWKYSGGYLTYVSAVKIRPKVHTVTYNANGGWGAPGNQTKTEGYAMNLSWSTPSRTGYTFKYWMASIGGNYSPGANYTHDQDGGVVTMTAYWKDETKPSVSSFSAVPNSWSAGNGTISLTVRDQGSGLSSIVVERYSNVSRSWSTVASWSCGGTTSAVSKSFAETSEGVFYYRLTVKDVAGNVTTSTTNWIYLDHSNPVLSGMNTTVTNWTNVAPVIRVSATDYFPSTSYTASGAKSVVIKDDSGRIVGNGVASATYTLEAKYEGIHTWYITATDGVGHTSSSQITTKYDITKPGIDGTEITFVRPDGVTVSGYCQDNIISQHVDDEASRSVNRPNSTSGLKAVTLYKVKGNVKTVIYSDTTRRDFVSSDTHSSFDAYYDINAVDEYMDYYLLVVSDHAGNITQKKLTSQKSLLTWFHTSIDRSNYDH